MKEKEKVSVDIRNLNRCLNEYRKLGHVLYLLVSVTIVAVLIYLLNKVHLFVFVLDFFKLLIPLFIGFVLAWLFSPIIDKLNNRMPRIAASILFYLILIGIVVILLVLLIPNFINQIKELLNSLPIILDEVKEIVSRFAGDGSEFEDNILKTISTVSNNFADTIPDKLILGTKNFISVMTTIVLGVMISFYLSNDYHKMNKKLLNALPEKYKDDAKDLVRRINNSLRDYVQGVFFVMMLVFISQSIGFTLAGMKAPLIFASICAITDIIPYFGPWIGAIPAIVVAFTISPLTAIFTIISIVIVQTLENNFYQPLIMGHAMKLHPVTIMLGLLIFGHFFGIVGMIIATPVVATLKIIFYFLDEKINFLEKINDRILNN